MIPIIKWTLWQRRWSALWWSIGAAALIVLNMIFYPSFKNDADELQKSFENLPDAAVQLFGGSTDFFSPVGFLNSQIFFMMLPLVLAMLAIGIGSTLLAREEQERTLETLLARPISRTHLLASKTIAGMVILLVVTLSTLVATIITANLVGLEDYTAQMIRATLVCFLLVLTFASIAFMLTATGRARGISLGITAIIAFGGYLVSSLAGTVSWLSVPSRVLPFHYYQSESILRGTYDWINTLYFIAVIALCGLVAWVMFRHRDLG